MGKESLTFDAESGQYGRECIAARSEDKTIEVRCPAYPADCSYIRVVRVGDKPTKHLEEIAYWDVEEWIDDDAHGVEVMGAIMGVIKELNKRAEQAN